MVAKVDKSGDDDKDWILCHSEGNIVICDGESKGSFRPTIVEK